MFADLDGISSFVTIIGLIAIVAWIADQTLGDIRHIWQDRPRRHP